jgi:hypothetical protein
VYPALKALAMLTRCNFQVAGDLRPVLPGTKEPLLKNAGAEHVCHFLFSADFVFGF